VQLLSAKFFASVEALAQKKQLALGEPVHERLIEVEDRAISLPI
jgi:hypothetical protein